MKTITLECLGQKTKALADLEKATQLNPKFVEAQVCFAVQTNDVAKAIRAANQACAHTKYQNEICLELLASLYATNGDFDNAIRWQQKALELPVLRIEWAKKRLENYRQKKLNEWDIDWDLVK